MEGQSIRSVIVDDDKTIGEILKELVSREHTSVDVFSDGFEAIEFQVATDGISKGSPKRC